MSAFVAGKGRNALSVASIIFGSLFFAAGETLSVMRPARAGDMGLSSFAAPLLRWAGVAFAVVGAVCG